MRLTLRASAAAVWPQVARLPLAASIVVLAVWAGLAFEAVDARAATSIEPYGEVARFGGFDEASEGAVYGSSTTSGLQEKLGEPARLVYPVGMAVDAHDSTVPLKDGYAIYVLDLLNPQELNTLAAKATPATAAALKLEYRIQKLGLHGEILATTRFTLDSSATAPGLVAGSLAVDEQTGQVYALVSDVPPTSGNEEEAGAVAAYALESWPTGTKGGQPLESRHQVAGPGTLQPGGASNLQGDVRGENIAVDDASESSIAIAGNEYTAASGFETTPTVERVDTSAHAGVLESAKWTGVAESEDAAAKASSELSSLVYAAGANPDGSLNLTLGPIESNPLRADQEPNVATVSGDLKTTTPVLPWASAGESEILDRDRDAAVSLHQDLEPERYRAITPVGASQEGGTLAPSVVQLAGEGETASGVYAGIVGQNPREQKGVDRQSGKPFSWVFGRAVEGEGGSEIVSLAPANLAIRLFDAAGVSLGMIGNVTAGGPCNLEGGPYGEREYYGSFAALVAGREGALFALVQPDLDSKASPYLTSPGSPAAKTITPPLARVQGDEVVEFEPGAGRECPQPSGSFSVTNESVSEPTKVTGTAPVTVAAGATVKLESEAALEGGSPWAYEWKSGAGGESKSEWLAAEQWAWPSNSAEFTYTKAGSYTAALALVNDFGTLTTQRTIKVVEGGDPTACFTTKGETAGSPVSFDASCTTYPQFDSISSYHWSFGDGHGATTAVPHVEHSYTEAGPKTVTLTVFDALNHEGHTTSTVTIAGAVTGGGENPGGGNNGGGAADMGGSAPGAGDTTPTEVNPRFASAASVHGTVAIAVSCPTGKTGCTGTIVLKAKVVKASSHHRHPVAVVIGRVAFSLTGGRSETVQVRLSSAALAFLRTHRLLRVQAVVAATDPAGHAKTVLVTATIHAASRKQRR